MAQLVQSVYEAPVQVEQLAWHAEHVSAAVALPPTHVKPASIVQVALQPSPATWFPSSQPSAPTRLPSPHTVAHVSMLVRLPPAQLYPASTVQFSLQPSPLTVLLSS